MAVDERSPLLPERADTAEPVNADDEAGQKNRLKVGISIMVALLGVFLANVDDSFALVTYESIASDFQDLSNAPWMLTGYTLGYCVALPVYASMSDYGEGRKKPLLAAYSLFGLGCTMSGAGLTLWQVIVGRVIAGIGGAGMTAMISVIITDIASLDRVAVLRSYVNVAGIAGRSFGGPVGGFLADTIGWRWSFLGQAPIALICFFIAGWQLPSKRLTTAKPNADTADAPKLSPRLRDLDFLGAVTFATTTTTFLLVMNIGGQKLPWDDPIVISLAFSCVVLGIAFILTEGFLARKPLIPLRLIRTENVGIFCLVQILLFLSRHSTISNVVPYFMRTEGATNTAAAKYIMLSSIGNAVGALLSGQIISRTYRYKALAMVSVLISILSHLLIALRWRHGTNVWESSYVFPAGLGAGMVLSTQFIALSASAPRPQLATAMGMYYLCQQFGRILGVSLSTAILRIDFRRTLERRLEDGPGKSQIIKGILNDIRFTDLLPKAMQTIERLSYLHSFQFAPILSVASYTLAILFIAYVGEKSLR